MDIHDINGTFLNSSETNCHLYHNFYPTIKDTDMNASKVLMIVGILSMILLGLVGNLLMCFALCSNSHLRTVTNIFTVNLGMTDLGIVCFVMPMWITGIVREHDITIYQVPFGISLCKFTSFLTLTLVFVSAATLACISFDKYVCICHPLKYPRKVTVIRVIIALIYIWIQGILLASTPLYGWGCYTFKPMSVPICNNLWLYSTSYSAICFTIGLLIPFVIMMASYVCIFQVARMQARRIQAFTMELVDPWGKPGEQKTGSLTCEDKDIMSTKHKVKPQTQQLKSSTFTSISKSLKTLQIAFIVVGIFVICWVPYVTMQFWSANHTEHRVSIGVEYICTLVAFANSSVNPLVFMLLTRDLRLTIKTLYKRFKTYVSTKRNVIGVVDSQTTQIHWPFLGQEASVQVIHLRVRPHLPSSSYYSSTDEDAEEDEEDKGIGEVPKLAEALFGVSQLFRGINRRQTHAKSSERTDSKRGVKPPDIMVQTDYVKNTACCFPEKEQPPVFSSALRMESDKQVKAIIGKQQKRSVEAWRE